MIAAALWIALLSPGQVEAPKSEPEAAIVEEKAPKGETPEQRKNRLGAARLLMPDLTLLAILSILFLFLGGVMLIIRTGQRVKRHPDRKPVKYFDLSVGDGPEPPPHEPSAEERLGGKSDGQTG
jgi:hypothetical protein